MESHCPCELTWSCNSFKVQLLLLLLLYQSILLFGLLFLHGPPDIMRDCPMIHQYVFLFTFLLVKIVMLTNMNADEYVHNRTSSLPCGRPCTSHASTLLSNTFYSPTDSPRNPGGIRRNELEFQNSSGFQGNPGENLPSIHYQRHNLKSTYFV